MLDLIKKLLNLLKILKSTDGVLLLTLCKHHRPSASIVQRLVSFILYAGHASKL